ncbi:MAG TPA: BatD family protein, partial [Puia sp.]|nr:BatD family protein [Puia sp.]
LESKPVAISIKPLPELNKPADFSGAVGKYSIKADMETKNITADDAAVLRVTLKGNGNIPVVNAPTVPWPDGVEPFDPTTKEDIDKTIAPIGGSKTFEYNFIPKKAGSYTIPAFQFSYFDPQSNSYKTTSTDVLTFSANASKKKNSPKYVAPPPVANNDGNGVLDFLQDHLEWVFAILILSGLAIYLLFQNRRLRKAQLAEQEAARLAREAELAKLSQQAAEPEDPLLYAKQLLNNGDYKSFYTELNRSIWKVLSNKLNIPSSELNKHNVILHLQAYGWTTENANLLKSTLNECEMKLYTPDYNEADIQRILLSAEKIVVLVG